MPSDTSSISKRDQIWRSLKSKKYRLAFASSHLATNIAAQIFALREKMGWTQRDLARESGMAQARISLIENVAYESFTIATLKRIAAAFDVMLVVRFVPFSEGVRWIVDDDTKKLAPASFDEDTILADARIRSPLDDFLAPRNQETRGLESYISGHYSNVPVRALQQVIPATTLHQVIPTTQRYLQ